MGKMNHWTPAEREEYVLRYRTSGLTQKQYCEEEGLSVATLGYWLKRARDQEEQQVGSFVPIQPAARDNKDIEIIYPDGIKVRMNHSVDVEYIRALLGQR